MTTTSNSTRGNGADPRQISRRVKGTYVAPANIKVDSALSR